MKTLKKPFLWLCSLLMVGLLTSHGAVLTWSNFTGADPDSSETKATFGPTGGALAIGISVGAPNYNLSSFSIDLLRPNNSATQARLRIYSGSVGGTLLGESSVSIAAARNVATITTFSGFNIALSQGQNIWFVVDSTDNTIHVRSAAGNNLPSGTANLSMLGYRTFDENLTTPGTLVTSDYPNFSVTVPEPEQYAIVAGSALTLFAVYRRRMKPACTTSL